MAAVGGLWQLLAAGRFAEATTDRVCHFHFVSRKSRVSAILTLWGTRRLARCLCLSITRKVKCYVGFAFRSGVAINVWRTDGRAGRQGQTS